MGMSELIIALVGFFAKVLIDRLGWKLPDLISPPKPNPIAYLQEHLQSVQDGDAEPDPKDLRKLKKVQELLAEVLKEPLAPAKPK